jgi:hypothetical protein
VAETRSIASFLIFLPLRSNSLPWDVPAALWLVAAENQLEAYFFSFNFDAFVTLSLSRGLNH